MTLATFLDCEFTDLARPQLLSLGMVTLDGASFYAEYDLAAEHGRALMAQAHPFVHESVVPFFGKVAGAVVASPQEFGDRLAAWVLSHGAALEVAYDYGWDFELLERVLRASGHWPHLAPLLQPAHVGYLWGAQAAHEAAQAHWHACRLRGEAARHHALSDAWALRAAYLAVHG